MSRKPSTALLILDMFNTFDFPEGKKLLPKAEQAAKKIVKFKERCKKMKMPVIYLNDNFGKWRSDWKELYDTCTKEKALGKRIAEMLKPGKEDYFVLKPKHSGFYSTTLEVLLEELHIETLMLTGIAGNICVFFTANDAHMRDFKVIIPRDCIASNTTKDNKYALDQFKNVFDFNTNPSSKLRL